MNDSAGTLGFTTWGAGPERVLVLHDWLGDHRNYEPIARYLDRDAFTYVLADLRGYGLSRERAGRFDLREAADDVLALVDALGWTRFHLVGHSMSTMVAQQVARDAPARVTSLVLVTPAPPEGLGAPAPAIAFMETIGGDESKRAEGLAARWDERAPKSWGAFKLARWAESARPEAAKAYVKMFASTSVSGTPREDLPVLALLGDRDAPHFQEAALRPPLAAAHARLEVVTFANVGHYPMQEIPVLFTAALERFLRAHA